jgi:hypothetical protein
MCTRGSSRVISSLNRRVRYSLTRTKAQYDQSHVGCLYTDKKENKIFLIYKEIQTGAVAKSCMRKGFLIYEEMRK